MNLDRWIALFFLVVSSIYGFAAFNFPLLPFERNMAFLPNTLPMVLSVMGAAISLFILVSAKPNNDNGGTMLTLTEAKQFKIGQTLGLVAAMIAYAVLLRPIGFLLATTLFLSGSGALLGERKFILLVPISMVAAFGIWYLVQQTLGIFLKPWPFFIS